MCIVVPCIWMFLCKPNDFTLCSNIANPSGPAYCFQTIRYQIVEDFGCFPGYYSSYASVIILFAVPLALGVATLVYGGEQASCDNFASTYLICSLATAIAFCHLIRNHRVQTKFLTPHLVFRNSGLSSSQYYRLMAMSMVIEIYGVVWLSMGLNAAIRFGFFPLPSWHELHKGDSTVLKHPVVSLSPAELAQNRLSWWGIPGGAYIFFIIFGTSKEVFLEYTRLWTWFSTTVLRRRLPAKERSMSTHRSG
jgi:pheromone a factor receptor